MSKEPIVIEYEPIMAKLTILEAKERALHEGIQQLLKQRPDDQELRYREAQAFGRWTGTVLAKAEVSKATLRSAIRGLWPA